MKKQLNEIKRMQQLAGLITESEYQESLMNETMYYVHDEEGMEEPIGPFTMDQAKQELAKQGAGWKMIDAATAKQIWSYLEDDMNEAKDESSLNEETSSVSDETYGEMDNLIYTDHKDDYDNFISSATNIMDTLVKNNFKVEDIFDYLKSRLEAEV